MTIYSSHTACTKTAARCQFIKNQSARMMQMTGSRTRHLARREAFAREMEAFDKVSGNATRAGSTVPRAHRQTGSIHKPSTRSARFPASRIPTKAAHSPT